MAHWEALFKAEESEQATDAALSAVLTTRTFSQLRQIFQEYQNISKKSIEDTINREFSGVILQGLLSIGKYLQFCLFSTDIINFNPKIFSSLVKFINSTNEFYADNLHEAMVGLGTDDKTLIRIIVGRSEIDLAAIKIPFELKYGNLQSWIDVSHFSSFIIASACIFSLNERT